MATPERRISLKSTILANTPFESLDPAKSLPPELASLLESTPPAVTELVHSSQLSLVSESRSGGAGRWRKQKAKALKEGGRQVQAFLIASKPVGPDPVLESASLVLAEVGSSPNKLLVGDVMDIKKAVLLVEPNCTWELRAPGDSVFLRAESSTRVDEWMTALRRVMFQAARTSLRETFGWKHRLMQGTLFSTALLGNRRGFVKVLASIALPSTDASPDGGAAEGGGAPGDDEVKASEPGDEAAAGQGSPAPPSAAVLDALNAVDEDGFTAMHLAVHNGHVDIIAELVAQGASANIQDAAGRTPLHMAAGQGHDAAVALMMANGADPDACDTLNQTPLHYCAACTNPGKAVRVARLLITGAGGVSGTSTPTAHLTQRATAQDYRGATPLHVVCETVVRVAHIRAGFPPAASASATSAASASAAAGAGSGSGSGPGSGSGSNSGAGTTDASSPSSSPPAPSPASVVFSDTAFLVLLKLLVSTDCPVNGRAGAEGWTALHLLCGAPSPTPNKSSVEVTPSDNPLPPSSGGIVCTRQASLMLKLGAAANSASLVSHETPLHLILRVATGQTTVSTHRPGSQAPSSSSSSSSTSPTPTVASASLVGLATELPQYGARLNLKDSTGMGVRDLALAAAEGATEPASDGEAHPFASLPLGLDSAVSNYQSLPGLTPAEPPAEVPKAEWMPDTAASACPICQVTFSKFTNSRHHCRYSGSLVCQHCSTKRVMFAAPKEVMRRPSFLGGADTGMQRVSDQCFTVLRQLEMPAEADDDAMDGLASPVGGSMSAAVAGHRGTKPPLMVELLQARNLNPLASQHVSKSTALPHASARVGMESHLTSPAVNGDAANPQWRGSPMVFGLLLGDAGDDSDDDSGEVAESVASAQAVEVEVWAGKRVIGGVSLRLGFVRATGTHYVMEGWRELKFRGDTVGEILVRVQEMVAKPTASDGTPLAAEAGDGATPGEDAAAGVLPVKMWILRGRNLMAADMDGFSDPYCTFKVDNSKAKTKVVRSTLNPNWGNDEVFRFVPGDGDRDAKAGEFPYVHVVHISVWDRDLLSPDDPLGDVAVDLRSAHATAGEPIEDWFPVMHKGKQEGELLIRLQEQVSRKTPGLTVATNKAAVDPSNIDVGMHSTSPHGTGTGQTVVWKLHSAGEGGDQAGDKAEAPEGKADDGKEDATDEAAPKPPKSCCVVM